MPLSGTRREPGLLRLLSEITSDLDRIRETDKALKTALRLAREIFGADEVCVAAKRSGKDRPEILFRLPGKTEWDPQIFTNLLAGRSADPPPNTFIAPIERRKRIWGGIGLRWKEAALDRSTRRGIFRFAAIVSKMIQRIDRLRLLEVRTRIDRKILEQLRPKDLFYQILHGLRSLTRYDHSAALLIHEESPGALELVAEQIAWRKGKSRNVGLVRDIDEGIQSLMESGDVFGFDRMDDRWIEWEGRDASALARVLDYNCREDCDEPDRREACLLCAPLATRDGVLGVLKVASCRPGTLGEYEADLVRGFLAHAAVAIRNLRRTESLEAGLLAAEKKHVMANLVRGVSHDINNALGSVLPLVQQMQDDARDGRVDAEVLEKDLEQIETSLQVCRRVFGGMLQLDRGSARGLGEANLPRAVESTLSILEEGMRRHRIEIVLDVPEDLPAVRGTQGDLEQLVLNFATNARDSMPGGGRLTIRASPEGRDVALEIEDTGVGIEPEDFGRIQEPFFTTKRHGNGFGLSICRSILWDLGGSFRIESEPGRGTRVSVQLPTASAVDAPEEQ